MVEHALRRLGSPSSQTYGATLSMSQYGRPIFFMRDLDAVASALRRQTIAFAVKRADEARFVRVDFDLAAQPDD